MTRIAVVQMDPQLGAVEKNLAAIASALVEAARAGAKLVVFPEAAVTGYCFDHRQEALDVAEPVPGRTVQHLAPLCAQFDVHAVVGTLERQGPDVFNAALLIGPSGAGGLVGAYRKTHLPRIGVDRFAVAGQGPFRLYDVAGLRLGMLICYDGGFPEAVRSHALNGADLVVLPTNWPVGAEVMAQHSSIVRAAENVVYFAAAGRVGAERGTRFIGGSAIVDPFGRVLAAAPPDQPAVLLADVDVNLARQKSQRNDAVNRIADRRPELYKRLLDD